MLTVGVMKCVKEQPQLGPMCLAHIAPMKEMPGIKNRFFYNMKVVILPKTWKNFQARNVLEQLVELIFGSIIDHHKICLFPLKSKIPILGDCCCFSREFHMQTLKTFAPPDVNKDQIQNLPHSVSLWNWYLWTGLFQEVKCHKLLHPSQKALELPAIFRTSGLILFLFQVQFIAQLQFHQLLHPKSTTLHLPYLC